MQFSRSGRKHTDSAAGRTVAACGRQGGKPGTTLPVIPSRPRFLVRLIFGKYPRKNRLAGRGRARDACRKYRKPNSYCCEVNGLEISGDVPRGTNCVLNDEHGNARVAGWAHGSPGAAAKSNMAYISRLSAISLALPPDITAIPLLQLDSSVMG